MTGGASIVTIQERVDDVGHHVSLSGRLDVRSVPDLRGPMHRLVASGRSTILVDLAGAEIGDATGFGFLVESMLRARRHDRRLVVVDADDRTRRLNRRARLDHLRGQVPAGLATS